MSEGNAAEAMPSIDEVAQQLKAEAVKIVKEVPSEKQGDISDKTEAAAPVEAAEIVEETAPTAEAVVEEKKVEAKDPISSKFAALSRKEKELRQLQETMARQQKEVEARQKAFEDRQKQFEEREAQIKTSRRPLDVLKAAGFKYEDATQDILGGYKVPEPDPVDTKLQPYVKVIEEQKKAIEQLTNKLNELDTGLKTQEQQKKYLEFVDAVKKTITGNPEKFEITAAMGDDAIDIVREVMVEYYTKNGALLSYEDACELVEEHYEKQSEKFTATNKVKSRFTTPPTAKPQAATTQPKEVSATPKTLTASMGTPGGEATVDIDKMSPREAIAYLSKQLKYI